MSKSVNPVDQSPYTGINTVDSLIDGYHWGGAIEYSFPDDISDFPYAEEVIYDALGYYNPYATYGWEFNTQQKIATHFALDADNDAATAGFSVEGFTNLSVSFDATPDSNDALRFVNVLQDLVFTAQAYTPWPDGDTDRADMYSGDMFFGFPEIQQAEAGNYGWFTILHELGHALGLKHPHESFPTMDLSYDHMEYTVISYRSFEGQNIDSYGLTNGNFDFAQTFMMLDIQALQYLYGADYTTNSGDTTYTWTPGSGDTRVNGEVAIDAGGSTIFATIWDGGGIDTYDLSAFSGGVRVDLRPGKSSVFSDDQLADLNYWGDGVDQFAQGNIYNALLFQGDKRSLIENAIGGSGQDRLVGNVADNLLVGNAGNDRLIGLAGRDTLEGGGGRDRLVGNGGKDDLVGGGGNDRINGGNHSDTIEGGAGRDVIRGGKGGDDLLGGKGADRFQFKNGDLVDMDKVSGGFLKKLNKLDAIMDFESGVDRIDFRRLNSVDGLEDLSLTARTLNGESVIEIKVDATNERLIVYTDVDVAGFLGDDNFMF